MEPNCCLCRNDTNREDVDETSASATEGKKLAPFSRGWRDGAGSKEEELMVNLIGGLGGDEGDSIAQEPGSCRFEKEKGKKNLIWDFRLWGKKKEENVSRDNK